MHRALVSSVCTLNLGSSAGCLAVFFFNILLQVLVGVYDLEIFPRPVSISVDSVKTGQICLW